MPGFGFGAPLGTETFGSLTADGSTLAQHSGVTLRIGAVTDAAKYLRTRSYQLSEQLNGRDTLDFELVTRDGFLPAIGQAVVLTWRGQVLFAGSIESMESVYFNVVDVNWRNIRVSCVDWNAILDRRTYGEVFTNVSAGSIVRQMITDILAADGIEAGIVHEGPIIAKAVYTYDFCSDILDDLSERTGYHWDVDDSKHLHFFQRTLIAAPWDVTVTAPIRDLRVPRTRNQYRNRQYFRGGSGVTAFQTETFRGDGSNRTFTVGYPIYEVPTIRRGNVSQTVGIRQIDQGVQWYWSKNDATITQDSSQPVLTANEGISVTYRGLYRIVAVMDDAARIAERQAVEGGSGLYEQVIVEESLDGDDVVMERSIGLLRRYGLDAEVQYETDTPGLAIGMLQTVTLNADNVSGGFLITAVEAQDFLLGQPRYRVSLSSGEAKGTQREFWNRLFASGFQLLIRENEFVQVPVQINEPVPLSESWVTPIERTAAEAVGIFHASSHVFGECEFGAP